MKLIYQQLLGFFLVIITSVMVMGYVMFNYSTKEAYEQNYARLSGYADSLEQLAETDNSNELVLDASFLDRVQVVMQGDEVTMRIFDANNQQVYPNVRPWHLPKKLFNRLKKGETIKVKNDHEKNTARLSSSQPYTSVLKPWFRHKKLVGVIVIGSRLTNIENTLRQYKHDLLITLLVSSLVASAFAVLISVYTSRKIRRLSQATKRVAAGNFEVHLPNDGHDEIDDLAENFNEMVDALKKSNEEITAQERRRDQFMADAAHEMRTPLTTINGILEGLQYNVIPEEAKPKSIALMQRETKRLIRLVNENLDYEKIRSNQIMLVKTKFDSRQVLTDLLTQMKRKAEEANDQLILDLPDSVQVYADHDRFTQMMVNLVQNALQFTQDGKIVISGRRLEHAARFSVRDTGLGMTEEEQKYIFERFYKADPSRARSNTGESGLGLAIVLSLVRQHGGKISVKSKLHEGSEFTITLYDEGYEQFVESK